MSQEEQDLLGNRIANVLDMAAIEHIEHNTLILLQTKRMEALESYQLASGIVNSGNSASAYGGHGNHFGVGKFLLLLALLLTFTSMAYTQFADHSFKFSSLNKLILTNDLPIDAYIDSEFDEWLDGE
ncbi:hypothetical protein W03_02230 [Nitrosomonas sp. PY1]|uniref:DUF3619 family protein n=1 Tax=Nitrosomonas sp. PY1 TaxID=1803906 RepID=UPI001FC7C336|nr:DUF3619 family protein [Nitrosomonas sp. PY1]GKS68219.1 hypothetical protein W03_02230 [Nitrosomonas sp. PY1]